MSNPLATVQTVVVSTLLSDGEHAIAIIGQALLMAAVLTVLFLRVLRFISARFGKDFKVQINVRPRRRPPPFEFVMTPKDVGKNGTPVSLAASEGFLRSSLSMPVFADSSSLHELDDFDRWTGEHRLVADADDYASDSMGWGAREDGDVQFNDRAYADTVIDADLEGPGSDSMPENNHLLTGNANGAM